MEIKKLAVVVLSALSLTSTAALAAPITVEGGSVRFEGSVTPGTCALNANSVEQTVQMGQVKTVTLATAGATSSHKDFKIQLDDCDTTISTKVSFGFLGVAVDSKNPNVLALDDSAAGSARNVGIQILDKTGTVVALDGANFSAKTNLIDGTNYIPFQARYYATGAAKPGQANANVTFKIQYE